jgi:hypothetical protein
MKDRVKVIALYGLNGYSQFFNLLFYLQLDIFEHILDRYVQRILATESDVFENNLDIYVHEKF